MCVWQSVAAKTSPSAWARSYRQRFQSLFFVVLALIPLALPRPSLLQIVSWLCDPFWKEVFGKSIQKLRTNSRNLYEIEDPSFRMLYAVLLLRLALFRCILECKSFILL